MQKSILLGIDNGFPYKTSKVIALSVYVSFLIWTGFQATKTEFPLGYILNAVLFTLLIIPIYLKTPITPRVIVSDSGIRWRRTFFSPTKEIQWPDIVQIYFESYNINFQLTEGEKSLAYRSDAKISKKIKGTIREIAEAKSIPVIGG